MSGGYPAARRKIVVGNWKMCRNTAPLDKLEAIAATAGRADLEVVICPPFPLLSAAARHRPALQIGAQDCHHLLEGPHTGSVSPALLRELGMSHVIVGHSERRAAFGETDADVCAKAAAAIGAGLVAIVCVGESAEERAAGQAGRIVAEQVERSLPAMARPHEILIAYEPIWAIGSGRTPTSAEIAEIHYSIRRTLHRNLGAAYSEAARLLYGGSVAAANAQRLITTPEVDGLLVGSSSLTKEFVAIIEIAGREWVTERKPAAA